MLLTVVIPLVMMAVLLTSAIAKFRHPDDRAGWAEMGVPKPLRRDVFVRLHPWGELLLGLLVAVSGGAVGSIFALITVVLMITYVILVVRVVRRGTDTSCACFGAPAAVTRTTVVRNVWLLALALATTVCTWTLPPLGGAVRGLATAGAWQGLVSAAVAAVTAVLVLRAGAATAASTTTTPSGGPEGSTAASDGEPPGEELDYLRVRTPAVPVTLADGTTVNLRSITATRPAMLLAVSPTCGACLAVVEQVPQWRALLPEVDIRLLLYDLPDDSKLTERTEPQSLHDPQQYVRGSLADWPTPTAILLGMDGLLAGGPVSGTSDIAEFVAAVDENLHGAPS